MGTIEFKGLPAQGWECPKCGSVYSPTTIMCMRCGNNGTSDLAKVINPSVLGR